MAVFTKERLHNIRFGLLYRKIALNETVNDNLSEIERDLFKSKVCINPDDVDPSLLGFSIRELLLEEESSQLLWLYRSVYYNGESLLHRIYPMMKTVSSIVRGGLNIYKRIGWDIHVLYAYQLICDNFPRNKSTFVPEAPKDFSVYKSIENGMDPEQRFILRLSTLLHDIGVVDGVKDHEKKGVRWVASRVDEIMITEDFLAECGVRLSLDEVKEITRFIVGNHQIMNQIGSEISDMYAAKQILSGAANITGYAESFFNSHIADIMYLLSAADLMAVNDTLLTPQKSLETQDAFGFFRAVMQNSIVERDNVKCGIQRFRSLLLDSMKDDFTDVVFCRHITALGFPPYEVADFLYRIPQMNYAMTFVKPQRDYDIGLKMFCLVYEFMKERSLEVNNTSIKFDPDIDFENAGNYLEITPVSQALSEGRIILGYDSQNQSININFEV